MPRAARARRAVAKRIENQEHSDPAVLERMRPLPSAANAGNNAVLSVLVVLAHAYGHRSLFKLKHALAQDCHYG
eukprot:5186932-Pleurochrysis_carterae.AAC.6